MLTKISVIIIALVVSFFAINKSDTRVDALKLDAQGRSSVSMSEGKYKIDTSIIRNDDNKIKLLKAVSTESFEVKKTINEIPPFIFDFLKSIAHGKKFEMVNPGEEWKCGIADFGHTVITKYWDPAAKDTVLKLCGDGAILPTKQMCYFGIGKSVALFTYYGSEFGSPGQNVVMIKFKDEKILDFWYRGYGFNNNSTKGDTLKITTKSEIIKTLNSKNTGGGC